MRLSPARFNRFLSGPVGTTLAWRKRSACPCVSPSSGSGSADPLCPLCRGRRHLWAAEVEGPAGLVNQTPQKLQAQFGVYETGDALLSIPQGSPLYAAGYYDRFRALEATTAFSQVIVPGGADTLFGAIVEITRAFWRAPDGQSLIEGTLPVVDGRGALSWSDPADAPPEGVSFTVEGRRFVEYFAFTSQPAERNVGVTGLPRKLGVRRLDLLSRFDEAGG